MLNVKENPNKVESNPSVFFVLFLLLLIDTRCPGHGHLLQKAASGPQIGECIMYFRRGRNINLLTADVT